MRSRPLRFVVGTTLLALGGCTSSVEREHTNVNEVPEPKEREHTNVDPVDDPKARDAKAAKQPEEDHVNVGPADDEKKDFAPNPGPQERGKPVVNVVKTPDPLDVPMPPATKTVDPAPK